MNIKREYFLININKRKNKSIFFLSLIHAMQCSVLLCFNASLNLHFCDSFLFVQGFMVAIFYCFVNSEVKNTFKHHFIRWNDARNLRTGGSRRFTYSKDWSPNTRSDSVRYYFNLIDVLI